MLYSKTTRGFYSPELHPREKIPADSIQISGEEYAALLAGQEAGLEIVPDADGRPVSHKTVQPVPRVVTMRQAQLAIFDAGLYDEVVSAIAALPDLQRQRAEIEWRGATVERSSDFVKLMANGLKLDDAALDALFTQAATL